MDWEIRPFEGVGRLLFGMTRQEVQAALGQMPRSFKKAPSEQQLTDAYDAAGLYAYFDGDDRLEYVELTDPRSVSFRGEHLFGLAAQSAEDRMRALHVDVARNDEGFDCLEIGVSVYAPSARIEGVGVGRKRYFEDLRQFLRKR